jgi:hypothetical protein
MIQGMNILRPDSSTSQPPKNSTKTCIKSHYLAYIKYPQYPSKRKKSGSGMRKRNQTDQTNMGRRSQPIDVRVTRKRSSRITARH